MVKQWKRVQELMIRNKNGRIEALGLKAHFILVIIQWLMAFYMNRLNMYAI